MILIFDYFETIVHNKSMDFNRGLKNVWENYYKDRCSFDDIAKYGEKLFEHMLELHKQGLEYAFVKDELPKYAEKYGGDVIKMTAENEADFLMKCNDMENMPCIPKALAAFEKRGITMYVLSNSGFTADALAIALEKLGIRKYFKRIWSSADFGKIKPNKEFFDMAIEQVLSDNPSEMREDIVFVGDTYDTDVKGAIGAEINVIWLNHKGKKRDEHSFVYVIRDTSELLGCVERLLMGNKWRNK